MDFRAEFDQKLSQIEDDRKANRTDIEEFQKQIDALQLDVKSRAHQLPTFDVNKYENQLQKARENSWSSSKPGRFKFKSKKPITKAPASADHAGTAILPTFSEKRVEFLMYDESLQNLNVSNLRNSTVFARQIESSLYLTNIETSTIYANCQQCRIHDCTDVHIYLENCPNPVIENCKNIVLDVPRPIIVSDFSFLNKELPNPNYSIREHTGWKSLREYTEADWEVITKRRQ